MINYKAKFVNNWQHWLCGNGSINLVHRKKFVRMLILERVVCQKEAGDRLCNHLSLRDEADALTLEMKTNDSMDVWSAAAVNLIHAYDRRYWFYQVVLWQSGGQIIPHLQNKINKHAWTPWGKVKIEAAAFINSAALLGVAHLVSNE